MHFMFAVKGCLSPLCWDVYFVQYLVANVFLISITYAQKGVGEFNPLLYEVFHY